MNLFQRVNVTATFGVITAVAGGLVRGISTNEATHQGATAYEYAAANHEILALAVFSIMLRFKSCFDDHYYFGKQHKNSRDYWTLAGFVLALFSWTAWIISGSFSNEPTYAAIWLVITLVISTIWIILHLIEEIYHGHNQVGEDSPSMRQRVYWIIINSVYISLLSVFGSSRDVTTVDNKDVLIVLYVVLLGDFVVSREQIAKAGHEK